MLTKIITLFLDILGSAVDVALAIIGLILHIFFYVSSTVFHRTLVFFAGRVFANPNVGVKLPPNPFFDVNGLTRAYDRCLELEKAAFHDSNGPVAGKPPLLTCARLLGYLLLEAPDTASRENMTARITNATDLKPLAMEFADFYCQYQRAVHFRVQPQRSDDPSYFVDIGEDICEGRSPNNYDSAKGAALLRDGCRCSITGIHDITAYRMIPAIKEKATNSRFFGRNPVVPTDPAYIFPPNVLDEDYLDPEERIYTLSHPILQVFGKDIIEELDGHAIHSLENIITLERNLQRMFSTFRLWLTETDTPNHYAVCFLDPNSRGPRYITLSSTDPKLPLPAPRYLRIHAACARAGMLSGVSNYAISLLRAP